jgi:hypothetical protein
MPSSLTKDSDNMGFTCCKQQCCKDLEKLKKEMKKLQKKNKQLNKKRKK